MKFIDLKGREIGISLSISKNNIGKTFRSNIQTLVGEKLIEKFPFEPILEDWVLPRSKMSLDFFLPRLKLAFEVSPSSTHQDYTPFFHGQKLSGKLYKQKHRDSEKARFCEINNIKLIIIENEEDLVKLDNI